MKLVIAEKPSVAMALASVLGARTRKDGYVEGNGYIVSWCVGHLVGLCDASEYDEKYKKWRYEICRLCRNAGDTRFWMNKEAVRNLEKTDERFQCR